MKLIGALVIGSKEHLKLLQPYLSDYVNNQTCIICNECDVLYNIGRWKAEKLVKFCAKNNVEEILFATTNETTHLIINQLREIKSKTCFIPHYKYPEISSAKNLKEATISFDITKPCLECMEFEVNTHCNLKCKGCSHYSNIETNPKFADLDQYTADLKKLKELFWGISKIRLLGGEPLLNPDLWKFIDATREAFPETDLLVVTNGLLIPKISDELVKHMKEAKAIFDITNYPPTVKIQDKILDKLHSEKIGYIYNPSQTIAFRKRLTRHPINDATEAFHNCMANTSNFLQNGTLSTCPIVTLTSKFNERFGLNYPIDYTNHLSEFDDGWELYENLHRPIPFCRYCSPIYEFYQWEICPNDKAKVEDWIINENTLKELKSMKKYQIPASKLYLNKHETLGRYIRYFHDKFR